MLHGRWIVELGYKRYIGIHQSVIASKLPNVAILDPLANVVVFHGNPFGYTFVTRCFHSYERLNLGVCRDISNGTQFEGKFRRNGLAYLNNV
ncbi:hypothetical protein D3C77_337320 [compost metagenome]